MRPILLLIASQMLGIQSMAQNMPGFHVTVTCQARSLTGGHPSHATLLTLGYWENRERTAYIFERDLLRVGLQATEIYPASNGQLRSDLLARDLDNNQIATYGKIEVQFDGTGTGRGFLHSNFESSEPYVLGSLELTNCHIIKESL